MRISSTITLLRYYNVMEMLCHKPLTLSTATPFLLTNMLSNIFFFRSIAGMLCVRVYAACVPFEFGHCFHFVGMASNVCKSIHSMQNRHSGRNMRQRKKNWKWEWATFHKRKKKEKIWNRFIHEYDANWYWKMTSTIVMTLAMTLCHW